MGVAGGRGHGGVVDEHVQTTQASDCRVYNLMYRTALAQIAGYQNMALPSEFRAGLLGRPRIASVMQGHAGSGLGERDCDGSADAVGGSCHQDAAGVVRQRCSSGFLALVGLAREGEERIQGAYTVHRPFYSDFD